MVATVSQLFQPTISRLEYQQQIRRQLLPTSKEKPRQCDAWCLILSKSRENHDRSTRGTCVAKCLRTGKQVWMTWEHEQ